MRPSAPARAQGQARPPAQARPGAPRGVLASLRSSAPFRPRLVGVRSPFRQRPPPAEAVLSLSERTALGLFDELNCAKHPTPHMLHDAGKLASDVSASRIVHMRYTIYSIHNIDAVTTSFFVDFKLEMRLVDLTTVHKRTAQRVFLDDEKLASIPFITIANAIDAGPCEQPIITLDPADPIGIVRWEQRFRGLVRLIQELHNFPFDHQELVIELRTEWFYRKLRPMGGSGSVQKKALAEWVLRRPLPLECYVNEAGRACATIRMQASRKPRFYVWNLLLVSFLLATLGLIAFAFPPDQLSERSSLLLTLLLTTMAFKFTADSMLILVESTIVFVIAEANPENAGVASRANQADLALLIIISIFWTALNVSLFYLVRSYYTRSSCHLRPGLDQLQDEVPIGNVHVLPGWMQTHPQQIAGEKARRVRKRWEKALAYAVTVVRDPAHEFRRAPIEPARPSQWQRSLRG
jgi:hypothetical protein